MSIKKSLNLVAVVLGLVLLAPIFIQAASTPSAFVVACVQTTVLSRETKLGAAVSAYTQAIQAAYASRNTSLNQAYSGDVANLKPAIKKSWSDFKTSVKNATKSWKDTRNTIWKDFRNAVKNCKAPSSAVDSGNSGSEINGQ
jgi:hypothetical protein